MAGIRLEFAQFGDFDSFDIIRSTSSMANIADTDLPSPIVTGLKTMYWVDANIIKGGTYYYKVRALKNGIEKISSEIKVIADKDLYFSNVVSLLHFDGANNSTTFTDQKGLTWSRVGNPVISTAQSKFGGSSAYFDGNSRIQSSFPALGTGDFTIEGWINIQTIVSSGTFPRIFMTGTGTTTAGSLNLRIEQNSNPPTLIGEIVLSSSSIAYISSGTGVSFPINSFCHFAFVRSGTNFYLFTNGVKGSAAVNSINLYGTEITLGSKYGGGDYYKGYIDDFRITKGIARYIDNFTPPVRAFPDN